MFKKWNSFALFWSDIFNVTMKPSDNVIALKELSSLSLNNYFLKRNGIAHLISFLLFLSHIFKNKTRAFLGFIFRKICTVITYVLKFFFIEIKLLAFE